MLGLILLNPLLPGWPSRDVKMMFITCPVTSGHHFVFFLHQI